MDTASQYVSHFHPDVDIKSITQAAVIANRALEKAGTGLHRALSTRQIAQIAEDTLISGGVDSGYIICVSPEEIAWHGIPNDRKLQEGQIVTIDIACSVRGWWADTAASFPVGTVDAVRTKLLNGALEGTFLAVKWVVQGNNGKQFGTEMHELCQRNNITLISEANGHGLGKTLHSEPFINYSGEVHATLKKGYVYTAEPVFTSGNGSISISEEGTAITRDGCPAAHFELSVLAGISESRVLGEPGWII